MGRQILKTIVVIPAYNPGGELLRLAGELRALFDPLIIVVDDGSVPETAPLFRHLAEHCVVIRHERNRGKGAALKKAAAYIAVHYPGSGYVTADADCQHLPADIFRITRALEANPRNFILGVRNFISAGVPFKSRWGNRITRTLFRAASGVSCVDTQTGLRGIPACFVEESARISGERFEYELNQLLEAVKKMPLTQVPIQTVYVDGNRSTSFRPLQDSLRVCFILLKFCCSSLFCAALDLLLFSLTLPLCNALMGASLAEVSPKGILAATVTARVFSGLCNFTLNRRWVFGSPPGAAGPALKYLVLFCAQMFASWLLVCSLGALRVNLTFLKALADTALFALSYHIQRAFVFPPAGSRRSVKKGGPHESLCPESNPGILS